MTYRLRTTMSAKVVVGCYVRDKRNKDSKIHFVVNEIDEQLDEYRCSSIGFNNQIKVVRRLRDLELVDDERTVKLIDEFNNFNPRKTVNRSPKRQLEKKSHRLSSLSAPSTRMKALMPDGVPRYIRCYDNGGVTADRYTVCFTGRYRHKSLGEYLYLTMSNDPSHPQGVGQHGSSKHRIDYPSYQHLGTKITFNELPEACRNLVLEDYKALWNITES